MNINKYFLLFGILPSLILPQLTADNVVLAKQDDLGADETSVFVEQTRNNSDVSLGDEAKTGQDGDYFEQPIYISTDSFEDHKSDILVLKSVIITGYSSTPDQTDSSPFITASGSRVRDGIIATNFLSFGTKVKFPELYGNKVFVVEDRMAKRNSHKVDIWFPDRASAIKFGVKNTDVVVVF
jgi:3D (Asp-Asp-Asp) domain-containing protein